MAGMSAGSGSGSHLAALDGLRGFAAASVVLFHIGHWLHLPGLAANSGLAVDFFFCLSGYVLALAYQRRFEAGMTTAGFLRVRLVRLMPLIVMGALVSFAFVLLRRFVKHQHVPLEEAFVALGLGLLNLPYFGASKDIGGPQVFPLNGPQYSLFLEVLVNLLWALTRRIRPLPFSLAIAAVSLVGVLWLGFGGDQTATFWRGLPRVGLSFFLGVAVFHLDRANWRDARRDVLFWTSAAAMAALFYFPLKLPFGVELAWVAALSPLLVFAGAGVRLAGPMNAAALLAGELSYPLYALHYPVFCWVNGLYLIVAKRPNLPLEGAAALVIILAASYAALRLFDQPVRRWLDARARRERLDREALAN